MSHRRLSAGKGLGDEVTRLMASAEREVVIIAPFIKKSAVKTVIAACNPSVPISVVGRFLPEDLAAKVSDFGAIEVLLDKADVELRSHPLLHGKLFRGDERCLVGSANLTQRAMGWARISNVELLVEYAYDSVIKAFEKGVLAGAEPFTEIRLRELRAKVRELGEINGPMSSEEVWKESFWIPRCRTPRYLFNVYAHEDEWRMLRSAKAAAEKDLSDLGEIPEGLDRGALESILRQVLLEHPLTRWLEGVGEATDEAAIQKIQELRNGAIDEEIPAKLLWEVFQEWVLYFLPDRVQEVSTRKKLVFGSNI